MALIMMMLLKILQGAVLLTGELIIPTTCVAVTGWNTFMVQQNNVLWRIRPLWLCVSLQFIPFRVCWVKLLLEHTVGVIVVSPVWRIGHSRRLWWGRRMGMGNKMAGSVDARGYSLEITKYHDCIGCHKQLVGSHRLCWLGNVIICVTLKEDKQLGETSLDDVTGRDDTKVSHRWFKIPRL